MIKVAMALLLLLILASDCLALDKDDWALIGATAFDFASGRIAANHGFREANPILGNKWYGQAITMSGFTALTLWCGHLCRKDGAPEWKKVVNYTGMAIHLGAGCWNLSLTIR